MKRSILVYSAVIGLAAFSLHWLNYKYTVRIFSPEIYALIIALTFTCLGIWVGLKLTGNRKAADTFERNQRALEYLGISDREYDVLLLLAEGLSNKEIADRLFVSPNTIKTHLAHLYQKLEVSRRQQAINKAKELQMIP
ncbi:MAG: response regulator transcription factor [Bacteroidota bacterium]